MEDIINVDSISVSFGSYKIFENFSLAFKNEITCILGPSGTGKSVLIKTILGMLKPKSGKVLIKNKQMKHKELVKEIGYMAQADALYEEFSARENVEYFASLYGIKSDKENINNVLSLSDLEKAGKKPVKYFSGGMKKRLSFAITLLHKPNILILDEPTVGIDPLLCQKFWSYFSDLKNQGKSVIVTTHVMDEASKADRVLFLDSGVVLADGNPKELCNQLSVKTIEEVFLHYAKAKI